MTTNENPNEEARLVPEARRGRGATKNFPTTNFEDVLLLPRTIVDHGASDQLRRLTVFDRLEKSPDSGPSRALVTASSRYGLTTGSYGAEYLLVTPDGRSISENTVPAPVVRQKCFQLAIMQFEPFKKLYEKLKNQRFPANDVMMDEAGQAGIVQADRSVAANIFVANVRFLGMVREVSGIERLLPIEQVVEELQSTPLPSNEVKDEVEVSLQEQIESQSPIVRVTKDPSVHIDIQIHIDSTASPEQIDQIFSSMARHLYGREN